MFVQVSLS